MGSQSFQKARSLQCGKVTFQREKCLFSCTLSWQGSPLLSDQVFFCKTDNDAVKQDNTWKDPDTWFVFSTCWLTQASDISFYNLKVICSQQSWDGGLTLLSRDRADSGAIQTGTGGSARMSLGDRNCDLPTFPSPVFLGERRVQGLMDLTFF